MTAFCVVCWYVCSIVANGIEVYVKILYTAKRKIDVMGGFTLNLSLRNLLDGREGTRKNQNYQVEWVRSDKGEGVEEQED